MDLLPSALIRLREYKALCECAFAQLSDEALLRAPSDDSAISLVTLVKHLHGNMLSRWTNFLTEDGEKPWRQREDEFVHESMSRAQLMELWEAGWACYLGALEALDENSLSQTVHIRHQPLSVADALLRQLMHYSYHLGQIVLLCKQAQGKAWKSLTIPKGGTKAFNEEMAKKEYPEQPAQ